MKKSESKQNQAAAKKYSAKSTVKELLAFLDHVVDNPVLLKHLDKQIKDRIAYTKKAIQNKEKVLKSDLVLLCNDAFENLQKKEAAIAKDAVKWAKSSEKKTETKPVVKKAAEKKEPEKSKPVEAKKPAKKPELFTKTFKDEDGMVYRLLNVQSLEEFKELQKGYSLVIATSWTEADLEKFDYGGHQITKKSDRPKKFENNLDLLQPVYVADRLPTIIAISLYTECAFSFRGDEFKKMDSNGMPFRIYAVVDPKEAEKKSSK